MSARWVYVLLSVLEYGKDCDSLDKAYTSNCLSFVHLLGFSCFPSRFCPGRSFLGSHCRCLVGRIAAADFADVWLDSWFLSSRTDEKTRWILWDNWQVLLSSSYFSSHRYLFDLVLPEMCTSRH